MKPRYFPFLFSFAALLMAGSAIAQQNDGRLAVNDDSGKAPPAAAPADSAARAAGVASTQPALVIQHLRPGDQRGINIFEAPKDDNVPFTGFRIDWTAGFAQQFQNLSHENTAAAKAAKDAAGKDYDANELIDIGWGFNLPSANFGLNAQLAPGIRVALETYLSSRRHQETWVKGGYLQVDESPIDHPLLHAVMDVVTIKAGMFPLNFGDAHFRRSDNGNVIYNPFVGNLILDAWTFEPGAEIYLRKNGLLAMGAVTSGSNKGDVTRPDARAPAFYGKVGFDRQLGDALRLRLTGSYYTASKTPTLYNGDRAGSRYYMVIENTQATANSNATSGILNPSFSSEVNAIQINPFVKFGGLEIFGVIERAEGRTAAETATRTVNQYAADVIYRFLEGDKLYVGGRYNTVAGRLAGMTSDISVDRTALAAGWFVTPTVLLKGEYVSQKYNDFAPTDIREGGRFGGLIIEAAVAF